MTVPVPVPLWVILNVYCGAPDCFTVNVCPAIVMVPLREVPVGLAETE